MIHQPFARLEPQRQCSWNLSPEGDLLQPRSNGSPSPGPERFSSIVAEGETATEVAQAFVIRAVPHSVTEWYGSQKTAKGSPSPWGEGRGEGDRRVQTCACVNRET